MRRVLWTASMAIVGLFFGLKGQGANPDVRGLVVATLWAAAIGYGFGSIFDQRRPEKRLIIYWMATLALLGLFFGPLLPITSFRTASAIGAAIGATVGTIVGVSQLGRAKRGPQSPNAGVATSQREA